MSASPDDAVFANGGYKRASLKQAEAAAESTAVAPSLRPVKSLIDWSARMGIDGREAA